MDTLGAVVFDVDGTLVDSERDGHRVAFNIAFAEAGLPDRWDVATYGPLLRITGGGRRLAHWFESQGRPAEQARELAQVLHRRKTEIMRGLVEDGRIGARPGVLRLLDELDHVGVAVHVATTGSRAWVARVFGPRFGTVVTGTEVTELKPSPAVYLRVMELTGCEPERTVAVEDSANGVRAAVGARLRCLAAYNDYTRTDDLTGATLVTGGVDAPELVAWVRERLPARR